jgi:hypothetical protein
LILRRVIKLLVAQQKIITRRGRKKLNGGYLIILALSAIYLLLLGLGQIYTCTLTLNDFLCLNDEITFIYLPKVRKGIVELEREICMIGLGCAQKICLGYSCIYLYPKS